MSIIDARDLPLGHDEACAADLHGVVTGRLLKRHDTTWLARAVAGAIRPSRDRPLWDLAHAVAALQLDAIALIDLALDPRLTTATALAEKFSRAPCSDDRGLTLTHPRPWQCSWTGLARVLSLAEFILTADTLDGFGEITALFGDGLPADAAPQAARRLSKRMHQYRLEHMPIAAVERRFQAIRGYLRDTNKRDTFDDDDIVAFWLSDAADDAQFTTIVDHFITYDRLRREIGAQSAISAAQQLSQIEDWESRLEAVTLPTIDPPVLRSTLAALADMQDGPKMLTGRELEGLAAVLELDPFHVSRPLTALRARVFGTIQSGIANRLRRGSGGADIATRVQCDDADYVAIYEEVTTLCAHLRRCLVIAFALRSSGTPNALTQEGERELTRMRRTGFDQERAQLAASVALIDGALATASEGIEAHRRALEKLARKSPLAASMTADKAVFSRAFSQIYGAYVQRVVQ